MSLATPLHWFPKPSDDVQHTNNVLQRATPRSPNFPNPNTHRFPVPTSMCPLSQPTAPGTGRPTASSPLSQTIDDAPACVPLPPTPPPKNAPWYLPPPPPTSRPPIPPSRKLSPPPEPSPSSPRQKLPPDAFHLPPILPQQSGLFPLNPRPRYVPACEAPTPPTDVAPPVNVSSATSALLRGLPTRTPTLRDRRWIPWILGLIVFNGGIVCFAMGITLLAVNAPYDSSTADADKNMNIATTVLSVVGFSSICCSTVHLVWLFHTRKQTRPQQDGTEGQGTRNIIGAAQGNRTLIASKRGGSALNSGSRRVLSIVAKQPTFTNGQQREASEGTTELTLVSRRRDPSRERHQSPRDEVSRTLFPVASLKSPSRLDSSCTRVVIEQPQKQDRLRVAGNMSSGHDYASSEKTSFLDLGDVIDQDGVFTAPVNEKWEVERISTRNQEASAGSSRDHQERTLQQRRQQQQPYMPAPLNPTRERWRAAQRAGGESSRPPRLFNSWLSNSMEEGINQDQENDSRMQDIARYTSSLKRLRQDGLSQDQRFGSTDPAQGQAVHIPKLAIRARIDIAKALGPAIERRVAAQTEHFKGKQKEEETVLEHDDDDHGDRAAQSTHSHSTSDADLRELASLAARSSGFPSVSSIAPLPNPIDSPQLGRQRPSAHRRSLSDSRTLETSRTTASYPISPTERGPGDLILRMRNAHKWSESAKQIPFAREVVAGEGAEFTLAPLLPATTYTPNLTRLGADNIAQLLTRPSIPLQVDAGLGLTGALRNLHARDIARREIVPTIQTQNVSYLATEHTLPTPPSPYVATISTASSLYLPLPSTDPSVAAAQQSPTGCAQTLTPARKSVSITAIQNEEI